MENILSPQANILPLVDGALIIRGHVVLLQHSFPLLNSRFLEAHTAILANEVATHVCEGVAVVGSPISFVTRIKRFCRLRTWYICIMVFLQTRCLCLGIKHSSIFTSRGINSASRTFINPENPLVKYLKSSVSHYARRSQKRAS